MPQPLSERQLILIAQRLTYALPGGYNDVRRFDIDSLVAEVRRYRREASEMCAVADAEIDRLADAIRKHRAQTGHGLCWENDLELWAELGDGETTYPHETVPPRGEFRLSGFLCRFGSFVIHIQNRIIVLTAPRIGV